MANDDAEDEALLWEVRSLRRQGYEPCIVVFQNTNGHVRTMSTLETEAEMICLLSRLLGCINDGLTEERERTH